MKSADDRGELVKELRWHYKQYVKTARRNKERLANVSVVLKKAGGEFDFPSQIELDSCFQICH